VLGVRGVVGVRRVVGVLRVLGVVGMRARCGVLGVIGVRSVLPRRSGCRVPSMRPRCGVFGMVRRISATGVRSVISRRRRLPGVAGVVPRWGCGMSRMPGVIRLRSVRGVGACRRMAGMPGGRRMTGVRLPRGGTVAFVSLRGGMLARVLRMRLAVLVRRGGRGALRALAHLRRRVALGLAAGTARAERHGSDQDGSNKSVHRESVT